MKFLCKVPEVALQTPLLRRHRWAMILQGCPFLKLGDTRRSLLPPQFPNKKTNKPSLKRCFRLQARQTRSVPLVLFTTRLPQRENPHAPKIRSICKHSHSKTPTCNYSQRARRRQKNPLFVFNSLLCAQKLLQEKPPAS